MKISVGMLAITLLVVGLSGCKDSQNGTAMAVPTKATTTATATRTATAPATDTATVTSTAVPTATSTPAPTLTSTPAPTKTKVVVSAPGEGGSGCSGANSGYESTLLSLINNERANSGAASLASSGSLFSLARAHSEDMAMNDYFDHDSLSGATPFDRMQSAGISFTAAAENIYAGNGSKDSPSAAFAGWMASEGHRANMLNSAYTMAGVGYWCDGSSTYGGYYTLDLMHP